MDKVLDHLNVRPQWSKTTGKGVRYAVLDYAPGNIVATPVNSGDFIHYHSYSSQYIIQTFAPDSQGFGVNVIGNANTNPWSIEEGLEWCFNNDIDVVNMSLHWAEQEPIKNMIRKLVSKGVIICAATGNGNKNKVSFPGNQPGVISVGAYYLNTGKVAEYSNSGQEIEVIAPTNVNIPHYIKGRSDINFNGTSCATPCISGVACLWKEIYPHGGYANFVEFLKERSIDYGEPGFDHISGYGVFRFPEPEMWIVEKEVLAEMRDINLLHPELQVKARKLIELTKQKLGLNIIISETFRTKAEQNALYAKGRTAPGSVVTKVQFPYSLHNWAIAFDIAVIINGKANWDLQYYKKIAPIGKSLGLENGGDWKSFKDWPHYQLPGYSVSALLNKYKTPENFISLFTKANINDTKKEEDNVAGFEGDAVVKFEGKELKSGILDGRTYVELRSLAEMLGLIVGWDNINKVATLNRKK